ncbi:hypothetical protein PoB_007045100 [Plakobranchus ocellatus]|uniref:Ubiquitin-like domain-containing protein n=1 Tax=Plakobranchus ocellatus TaxID=259542 RepID=A0AAV4DIH1_9GAST|nr:hypothetical protein PoB_007045100 [Plakobranchus ocellatus]
MSLEQGQLARLVKTFPIALTKSSVEIKGEKTKLMVKDKCAIKRDVLIQGQQLDTVNQFKLIRGNHQRWRLKMRSFCKSRIPNDCAHQTQKNNNGEMTTSQFTARSDCCVHWFSPSSSTRVRQVLSQTQKNNNGEMTTSQFTARSDCCVHWFSPSSSTRVRQELSQTKLSDRDWIERVIRYNSLTETEKQTRHLSFSRQASYQRGHRSPSITAFLYNLQINITHNPFTPLILRVASWQIFLKGLETLRQFLNFQSQHGIHARLRTSSANPAPPALITLRDLSAALAQTLLAVECGLDAVMVYHSTAITHMQILLTLECSRDGVLYHSTAITYMQTILTVECGRDSVWYYSTAITHMQILLTVECSCDDVSLNSYNPHSAAVKAYHRAFRDANLGYGPLEELS